RPEKVGWLLGVKEREHDPAPSVIRAQLVGDGEQDRDGGGIIVGTRRRDYAVVVCPKQNARERAVGTRKLTNQIGESYAICRVRQCEGRTAIKLQTDLCHSPYEVCLCLAVANSSRSPTLRSR